MSAGTWIGRVTIVGALVLPVAVAVGHAPVAAADVASVSCAAAPAGTAPASTPLASFSPTTPQRLVDTRDGTGGVSGRIGAGCTLQLDMAATGITGSAAAFALSLTGISPNGGYLTVYPCAAGLPPTSNLNTRPGVPTPNLAVARPDAADRICIFSEAETHLLVDVTGWWTATGATR